MRCSFNFPNISICLFYSFFFLLSIPFYKLKNKHIFFLFFPRLNFLYLFFYFLLLSISFNRSIRYLFGDSVIHRCARRAHRRLLNFYLDLSNVFQWKTEKKNWTNTIIDFDDGVCILICAQSPKTKRKPSSFRFILFFFAAAAAASFPYEYVPPEYVNVYNKYRYI